MQILFSARAVVAADFKVSLSTETNHAASFADVRRAMEALRDELSRILEEGPSKCPFRNHKGTSEYK